MMMTQSKSSYKSDEKESVEDDDDNYEDDDDDENLFNEELVEVGSELVEDVRSDESKLTDDNHTINNHQDQLHALDLN